MESDLLFAGPHDPDLGRACLEVELDVPRNLTRRISRGDDLDSQVGCEFEISIFCFGEAAGCHEREIGRQDRIWISVEDEANVANQKLA